MTHTPVTVSACLERLAGFDHLSAQDIAALRQAIYADGTVSLDEARVILKLHANGGTRADEVAWADLFVEAIGDYYALQRETPDYGTDYAVSFAQNIRNAAGALAGGLGRAPKERTFAWSNVDGRVSTREAEALITAFRAQCGDVLDAVERRALTRILERVVCLPPSVKQFALDAVYATVLVDKRIDADEVSMLKAVLWGAGSDSGIAISRQEAEVLFALKRATRDADNVASWADVFVKGVLSHLLFAGTTPHHVDAGEAAWLMVKLNPPGALDDLEAALVEAIVREADAVDPRLGAYLPRSTAA